MGKEKKGDGRFVTSQEYEDYYWKKVGYTVGVFCLWLIVGYVGLGAIGDWVHCLEDPFIKERDVHVLLTCVAGCLALILLLVAVQSTQKVYKMERVQPLPKENLGHQSEKETLVRASEEPPAQQADVLLRAAQGGQETAEEQLLRPVEK